MSNLNGRTSIASLSVIQGVQNYFPPALLQESSSILKCSGPELLHTMRLGSYCRDVQHFGKVKSEYAVQVSLVHRKEVFSLTSVPKNASLVVGESKQQLPGI